jgi:hypothetical protein
MHFMIGRRTWGTVKAPHWMAAQMAAVALLAGLLGMLSQYQTAEASDNWTVLQPATPTQVAACEAPGVQNPVDAAGGTITLRMSNNGPITQERTPIHQLTLNGSGDKVNNFCLDVNKRILDNVVYCQVGGENRPQLVFLITKYPPSLTDRVQQAARQAAVWHLTNQINLEVPDATTEGPATDEAVLAAYNAILADVEATVPVGDPPAQYLPGPLALTIVPTDTVHVLPGEPDHNFTVNLTNGGKPLVGFTVTVTSTFGTLDKASGVTDSQGQVAFTLTSQAFGNATITAAADVTLPFVSVYLKEDNPTVEQPIGNPTESNESVSVQAAASWRSPSALDEVGEPGAGWLLFLPALSD